MSDKNIDLLLKNIIDSLSRTRIIMMLNLSLCAVILSNIYVENWSFDTEQLKYAYAVYEKHDNYFLGINECIKQLNNPNMRPQDNSACTNEIREEISVLDEEQITAKKSLAHYGRKFAENSLNDIKLTSTQMPVLGLKVPSNDLTAICGIFMLMISVWLVFSTNQLDQIFSDDDIKEELAKHKLGLKHSFVTIYSGEHWRLRAMAVAVLLAPAVTMALASLNNAVHRSSSSLDCLSRWQSPSALRGRDLMQSEFGTS